MGKEKEKEKFFFLNGYLYKGEFKMTVKINMVNILIVIKISTKGK